MTSDGQGELAGQALPDVGRPRPARQLWADVIRVAAVLMIFLYHAVPDWLKTTSAEPGTAEQFIISHFATWAIAGFVVLSGFSLTLTLSTPRRSTRSFLSHRLSRILSPFWTVAIPFSLAGFALGEEAWGDIWKLPIWLLGLGPVHPSTYQPISEAWWYVSLALQISLVMPLLLRVRRAIGLVPFSIFAVFVNVIALALVSLIRPEWKHLAQGLVVCRLAELVIGIAACELTLVARRDRRKLGTALLCMAFVMAVSPLLDLLGMWTGWEAMLGLAVLFTAGALSAAVFPGTPRGLSWAAALSYTFYLTHAPVSKYAGRLLFRTGIDHVVIALPVLLVVCILVAWLADWVARRWVMPRISGLLERLLLRRTARPGPAS